MYRILLCCWLFSLGALAADQWPAYRGPNGDGTTSGEGLLETWPAEGPPKLWEVPLGSGFSAIVVVGDRLYTGISDRETEKEYLAAFDRANGNELWRVEIGPAFSDEFGYGPRSSASYDGKNLIMLGTGGHLHGIDTNGKPLWQVSLTETFAGKGGRWGYSMSPLIQDKMVLVEAGGGKDKGLAAIDAATGKTIWAATGADCETIDASIEVGRVIDGALT